MIPARQPSRAIALAFAVLCAAGGARAQQVVGMPRSDGATSPPIAAASLPQIITMPVAPVQLIDRWAPYIHEASERFGVPESWIREVMRMESGGNALALSHANAMGLMQVIPSTYAMLRWQHDLGSNPYDPRDNILAGTAYIREMYDLHGFPAFLAAYNAGPGRVDRFMAGQSLPAETVNYLAVLGPRLQGTTLAEGPLAAFLRTPNAPATAANSAYVIHIAQALGMSQPATPPASGAQVIHIGSSGARPVEPPREANGLVPRGMLGGPQFILMPKISDGATAIPVPAAVLLGLSRAAPRR